MNIAEVPVNQVFGGTANFVSRAILDLGRADVPEVRLLLRNAISDIDNLDDFTVVPLELVTANGQRRRFANWRHEYRSPTRVAIQLPLDEDYKKALKGDCVRVGGLHLDTQAIDPSSKPRPTQCRWLPAPVLWPVEGQYVPSPL